MKSRRAVFLDLNGTLVMPVQPERLAELSIISGAVEAVRRLTTAGFICPVVTVQSRVAKGVFTSDDFADWFAGFQKTLRQEGAELAGPYVCPHRHSDPCPCKKPATLLYEQAVADNGIDLGTSFVVGDTAGDLEAAAALGAVGILVQTGWGHFESNREAATRLGSHVADSLVDAVDQILEFNHAS